MKHIDCKYYLPIDAFKGICKRDKSNITADGNACDHFEKTQKCKFCSNFSATDENMGLCMKKYDAYPEMNATTCNDFQWK